MLPPEAAADLMYNLLDRKIQEQDESGEEKKSKKGITLLAVLAIMSTPVTVPLFIAMLAVLLAAAICVVCVIISAPDKEYGKETSPLSNSLPPTSKILNAAIKLLKTQLSISMNILVIQMRKVSRD